MLARLSEATRSPATGLLEVDLSQELRVAGELHTEVAGDLGRHRKLVNEDSGLTTRFSEKRSEKRRWGIERERNAYAYLVVRPDVALAKLVRVDR